MCLLLPDGILTNRQLLFHLALKSGRLWVKYHSNIYQSCDLGKNFHFLIYFYMVVKLGVKIAPTL